MIEAIYFLSAWSIMCLSLAAGAALADWIEGRDDD